MKYERLTERDWHKEKFYPTTDNERVIRKRLWDLENKIEQGTLIELPCKVGDIVWVVCGDISQYKVTEFWYDGVFFNFRGENNEYVEEHKRFRFFDERIGKTVFLTREEAEAKLKELQE